jgi:hypothetical protein
MIVPSDDTERKRHFPIQFLRVDIGVKNFRKQLTKYQKAYKVTLKSTS